MTDSRREILSLVAQVSSAAPDVRLGQLMAHLGLLGEAHHGKELAELQDDELAAVLIRHLAELKSLSSGAPAVAHPELASGYAARPA
jgi:hypothetical protein